MKKSKIFTDYFTKKISELSKLKLDTKEVSYFSNQFDKTIDIISNLNKLSTKSLKEVYNITGLKNVFREDKVDRDRILTQTEALSCANRTYKGFFVVKGIFDEK